MRARCSALFLSLPSLLFVAWAANPFHLGGWIVCVRDALLLIFRNLLCSSLAWRRRSSPSGRLIMRARCSALFLSFATFSALRLLGRRRSSPSGRLILCVRDALLSSYLSQPSLLFACLGGDPVHLGGWIYACKKLCSLLIFRNLLCSFLAWAAKIQSIWDTTLTMCKRFFFKVFLCSPLA